MAVKVLIADDHELYRDGLRLLLVKSFPSVSVIESGDFLSTKAALAANQDIALVLLDIHMPGTTGLNGLKDIKERYPALPVVVVSTVDYQASIQQMLKLGADGFIAKTSSKFTMIQSLKAVLKGEFVIVSGQENSDPVTLSPRQIDTLELVARGMPNKEIATKLNISNATVREHVSDILKLFRCENRTQAVLKAQQLGFIVE